MIIALINPKIPPNTGNIGRICAANNVTLHLVGTLGFDLSDAAVRRAGLDYWPYLNWERFEDADAYMTNLNPEKTHVLTVRSNKPYTQCTFEDDHTLVYGSEDKGLDEKYHKQFKDQCCTIPMKNPNVRSLNLANSVAIVLYHAMHSQ
ncbi:MAG: tRNA (cytidine(34)-2'-O)-methyltransferase [bacterium]|nr:tRNA (cytidine(34)-2'-O)-methyltransferase [bacterium]